ASPLGTGPSCGSAPPTLIEGTDTAATVSSLHALVVLISKESENKLRRMALRVTSAVCPRQSTNSNTTRGFSSGSRREYRWSPTNAREPAQPRPEELRLGPRGALPSAHLQIARRSRAQATGGPHR